MPVPGRTTETVKNEIDPDTVPLDGGVLIRTLVLAMDPYLRNKMQRSQRNVSSPYGCNNLALTMYRGH
jgi:NADPH-dependent curcumin reductase CurA